MNGHQAPGPGENKRLEPGGERLASPSLPAEAAGGEAALKDAALPTLVPPEHVAEREQPDEPGAIPAEKYDLAALGERGILCKHTPPLEQIPTFLNHASAILASLKLPGEIATEINAELFKKRSDADLKLLNELWISSPFRQLAMVWRYDLARDTATMESASLIGLAYIYSKLVSASSVVAWEVAKNNGSPNRSGGICASKEELFSKIEKFFRTPEHVGSAVGDLVRLEWAKKSDLEETACLKAMLHPYFKLREQVPAEEQRGLRAWVKSHFEKPPPRALADLTEGPLAKVDVKFLEALKNAPSIRTGTGTAEAPGGEVKIPTDKGPVLPSPYYSSSSLADLRNVAAFHHRGECDDGRLLSSFQYYLKNRESIPESGYFVIVDGIPIGAYYGAAGVHRELHRQLVRHKKMDSYNPVRAEDFGTYDIAILWDAVAKLDKVTDLDRFRKSIDTIERVVSNTTPRINAEYRENLLALFRERANLLIEEYLQRQDPDDVDLLIEGGEALLIKNNVGGGSRDH